MILSLAMWHTERKIWKVTFSLWRTVESRDSQACQFHLIVLSSSLAIG